ncbi:MAG: 50S ribosomal protein L4 [Acidobacteriales bacterium]|nr:50S ribosomal protein L4 [Terriglobales bacterium]
MATIDVVDLSGKKVGTFELAEEVFGAVNEALLWEAVNHYRAAQRAGTHATKNKKLVSGSGKKLWKQKGTGRARVGSVRSPIWRHGGTAHGPQPRSYDFAFPKKKVHGALRSALASKLEDGKLTVVESLESASGKTKDMRKALETLGVEKTAVLVSNLSAETAEQSTKLVLSTRNLKGVALVAGHEVHPYHLLRYDRAIFSRPAIERLQESLKKTASKRRASSAGQEVA